MEFEICRAVTIKSPSRVTETKIPLRYRTLAGLLVWGSIADMWIACAFERIESLNSSVHARSRV